jgi:hypothetical protein
MLRIMHRVCGPALGAAFLLIGMSAMGITDAAAHGRSRFGNRVSSRYRMWSNAPT